ncbi:ABC transporter ATP-binding protein/permease [Candidatus Saccharibacteria bacterium]|nr:ABC transporter ATP-binding protein/permease [Candidatus Saccharibacteria bacterium]
MTKSEDMTLARRTMHYYWQEVKRNWRYNLPLLLSVPIAIFLGGYASNWIISEVINKLTATPVESGQVWSEFGVFIMLYSVAVLLSEVFWRLIMFLGWKSEIISIGRLNQQCFESISRQTMHFHNNKFGGSLVNQVNRFSRAFERLMDTAIWQILPIISAFTFTFIILGPRFPQFTIGLAILSFGFMLVAWFSFKKTRDLSKKEANSHNKMVGQLADSITNVSTVKSYSGEDLERRLYEQRVRHWKDSTLAVMRAIVKRDLGFGLILTAISIMTIIFLAGGQAWFGVQIGTLVLAVTYMISLLGRLWDFNRVLRDVNQALADAHEMTEILDTPNRVKDVTDAKPLLTTPTHSGKVEFHNVSFKHADGGEHIFKHFDLSIPAGQRIGLVGHSGSGKTTLTKLLLRFSDVQSGQILIDGQNIAKVTQDSLRRAIAYVPQEPMLFHRTVAENISYGRSDATDTEIHEAAKQANAIEFIKKLPKKFKTLTGERGVKLSGGQKQRVAIARAILKDAPILVLDEATSALDTESEKLIQDALKNLMRGRTSIVIAHRLSTVAELDRIIVLDDGKIVEDGSHEELLARNGKYAQLWNRQAGLCGVIDTDEEAE